MEIAIIYINKTTNSGNNWSTSFDDWNSLGTGTPKIQFVTDEIGYALSGNSILKTIDGGIFVSVNDFDYTNSLNIYPNPTNGIITVSLVNNTIIRKFEIYTVIGKQIYNKYKDESEFSIDISNYPKGTYLMKIQDEKSNVYNVKMLKI